MDQHHLNQSYQTTGTLVKVSLHEIIINYPMVEAVIRLGHRRTGTIFSKFVQGLPIQKFICISTMTLKSREKCGIRNYFVNSNKKKIPWT